MIGFLKDKHFRAAEIHRQIVEVCGEGKECEEMVSVVQRRHGNAPPNAACQYTRITRNGSGGEFSKILHTVPTLHK